MKKASMAIDCPQCSKKAVLHHLIKSIPRFGKILISTLYCKHCGFKLNDVMAAEFHKPCKFEAKISKPADLRTKVVRSGSATISIPELGVRIEPGALSEGYYTNIEGVLERIENAAKIVLNSGQFRKEGEQKTALKELEKIQKAKKGKHPFTLIILDHFGNSALIGKKAKKIKLSEKELKKLKKNIQIIGG